ncbi:ABC transporter substrate-binding protein [Anaerosporobacter sp.]|uniref:ABC transporter substrate-binding protein n=1 Tax=Anaerosporobacter sp. TaxID=1872529 RepID=UPI00286F0884|nr:extracellular solute-binding protein [Anaerosporobacter sp.]
MKKKMVSVLCGIMACTMLVACGTNPNKGKETKNSEAVSTEDKNVDNNTNNNETESTLSGKIVIATNMTNVVDTTLAAMANEFMAAHPGTTIEYEGIKDYDSVISTRVSSGEAPDIFLVIDGMTTDTLDDYFLPLDGLDIKWDDIYFSTQNTGSDGKIYAIADSVNYAGFVYNKAAFREAGVEVPTTKEEFFTVCEKLKEVGITPVGTAFKDVWPIYPWVGWDIAQININGNAKGKNLYLGSNEIFDTTMVESMGTIRELYQKGFLEADIMSANWDQLKVDLSSGKTAMYYSESWLPAQIVEGGAAAEDVGMFPYPGSKGVYMSSGKSYGISKDCKNPELAMAYLKFMLEDGRHAKAISTLPADKTSKIQDSFVAELLSYGVSAVENEVTDPEFDKLRNKIELDEQSLLMTYVMEKDDAAAQSILDGWNEKWVAAQK